MFHRISMVMLCHVSSHCRISKLWCFADICSWPMALWDMKKNRNTRTGHPHLMCLLYSFMVLCFFLLQHPFRTCHRTSPPYNSDQMEISWKRGTPVFIHFGVPLFEEIPNNMSVYMRLKPCMFHGCLRPLPTAAPTETLYTEAEMLSWWSIMGDGLVKKGKSTGDFHRFSMIFAIHMGLSCKISRKPIQWKRIWADMGDGISAVWMLLVRCGVPEGFVLPSKKVGSLP